MTTTPQQIDALFAMVRVGSDLVKVARRLLIGIDSEDVELTADTVEELRALVRAYGQARAAMVDAADTRDEVRS